MDEEGNITGDLPDEDFLGVMSSLADDALVNKDVKGNPLIDTRILNDEAGRKKYLKNYSGYFPQGHRRGKFNSKDFLGRQAGSKPDNNNKGDRTSTHKKSKLRTKPKNDQYLVNTDVDVNIKSDKVKALIEEAQTHKWETTPHTSGLLLRSIIELCLKTRIKGLNLWKEVINLNKQNPIVGLSKLIEFTFTHKEILDDNELYEAFKADYHHGMKRFKQVLDFIQHNDQHRLTTEDLRDIRMRTEPLVRHLVETLPSIPNKAENPETCADDILTEVTSEET